MKPTNLTAIVAMMAVATSYSGSAQAREQIRIVGSSTVFPFSSAAAEQFGQGGKFKTPIVESTGTGGGLSCFVLAWVKPPRISPAHPVRSRTAKKPAAKAMAWAPLPKSRSVMMASSVSGNLAK